MQGSIPLLLVTTLHSSTHIQATNQVIERRKINASAATVHKQKRENNDYKDKDNKDNNYNQEN